MKKRLMFLVIMVLTCNISFSYNSTIMDIAKREYPNDKQMQQYTYNNQLSSKNYMRSTTNSNAKNKAIREYPNDYSMQKYIYENEAY